jgi:pimeloyl-ACP methyl ester carboxylesterase
VLLHSRKVVQNAAVLVSFLAALGSPLQAQPNPLALHSVRVNRVVLHYVDQGRGPVVVLVHGGMEDYEAWKAQFAPLSKSYRVIAYSRRYNYPNHNAMRSDNHSALVDADDLAALIGKLKLGPVRVVGHSYGAYISMFLALRHPDLVRSLVLSEPPLMKWLSEIPGGKPLLDDSMSNMWLPCADAFRHHQPETALRITVDWFGSHESPPSGESATYDALPAEVRSLLRRDIREWEALTTSRDAFPALLREQARQIRKPVLLLSGSRSVPALRLIAAELARTLPAVEFVVLQGATHEMWNEAPQQLTEKILPFLGK